MDLGINGKWALVCAASKGLGRGCAEALAAAAKTDGTICVTGSLYLVGEATALATAS